MEKIKTILFNKNIKQFKIIKNKENIFMYKYIKKKYSFEEIFNGNTLVRFVYKNKFYKLTFPVEISPQYITQLLNIVTQTPYKYHCIESERTNKKTQQPTSVPVFKNFIKNEIEKCHTISDCNFDLIYQIKVQNQTLYTQNKKYKQTSKSFECFAFDPTNPSKQMFLTSPYTLYFPISNQIQNLNNHVNTYAYSNLKVNNTKILVKAGIVAKILNKCINDFYIDRIYNNQSFLNLKDLKTKYFKHKFHLIAEPFNKIIFDADGSLIPKKYIIKDGFFFDVFCNNYYSDLFNLQSNGNASFENENTICHQQLKLIFPKESNINSNINNIPQIFHLENLYIDLKNTAISGHISFMQNKTPFFCLCNIDLNNIIDICAIKRTYKWIDNVFCPDILISLK